MISPHSKAVLEANEKRFQPAEKLCATLDGREGYVVHHRALRTYLKLNMRITGVHRVLVFTERAWLKPYVSHNFQQRSRAANAFQCMGFGKLQATWKLLHEPQVFSGQE